MKIGTITFHRAQNYGGVLQCYALVKFLQLCGYDAEVVDYRCPQIEQAYKIWNIKSLKSVIISAIYLFRNVKSNANFANFRKSFLKTSRKIYRKSEDFYNQYDVCIIGSDQVWTLRLIGGFNPVYYGDFSKFIRKVGYAVSVAEITNYSNEERAVMANHLNNFSHFSTREDSFRDELIRISNSEVSSVLDPSLLLTKEEYTEIIEEPNDKDYVLYYQQEYNSKTKNIIIDVAKQVGAKKIVVVTGRKEVYDYPYVYYGTDSLSVPKFLGLIKNAMLVFTSSFHGTAYSIVFHKDFYFVANNAPERARNLLSKLGVVDRLIYSSDKIEFSKVDYSRVEPLLNAERDCSIDFLISAIENK